MSSRIAWALLALVLVPSTGTAQNRGAAPVYSTMTPPPPPPAPLPRPEIPPPPDILSSIRPDLFRAAPDTYTVKPPEDLGLFFPQPPFATVWPVWGSPVWPGYYQELYRRAGEVRPEPPTMRIVVEHVGPPPVSVAPVQPATTMPMVIAPQPGHRRTLYVIPGCYAGDKLPRADQLRAGCSLRSARTISPVL